MERYINMKVPRYLSGYFMYQNLLRTNLEVVCYNVEYNIRELDRYLQINKDNINQKLKRIIIKTKNKYRYLRSQYRYHYRYNKLTSKAESSIRRLDNYYGDLISGLMNNKIDLNEF